MVFLSKPGRSTHANAKDFKPIILTSFMLKVLEKLMDKHLRAILEDTLSSAYIKGRSTETGLHEVINVYNRYNHDN